jgi:hypothetical protein
MTSALSIPIGKQNRKMSSEEWREIWLEKMRQALSAKKFKASTIEGFIDIVDRYLASYTCHPGMIPQEKVFEFLAKNKKSEMQERFFRDALVFFYTNVVRSDNHVKSIKREPALNFWNNKKPQNTSDIKPQTINEVIKSPQEIPQKSSEETIAQSIKNNLKRLQNELQLRNYSQRTLKNYSTIVYRYLLWLKNEPSENDTSNIRDDELNLREEFNFAPRTINLVSAALMFFYSEVLKLAISFESIPRMKTGKDLPNVYSQGRQQHFTIYHIMGIFPKEDSDDVFA